MKHALLACACLCLAGLTFASDDPAKTKSRVLFDGTSTEGWEQAGPGKFVLEDGVMHTEGGMGLFWYTKEKLGDCVIKVVYKTTKPQDNSGVFIRIADKPADEWFAVHHGFEVQINDAADEHHRTGAVYSMSKVDKKPAKPGEWNTLEITLKGELIVVTVNGVEVTRFDPSKDPIPARTKEYEPERGPRPTHGYIGLQNHDDESRVYFKEVSVRSL